MREVFQVEGAAVQMEFRVVHDNRVFAEVH